MEKENFPVFSWLAEFETSTDNQQAPLARSFFQQWGDFTPATLLHVAQHEEGYQKLFAITALGMLESQEADPLLLTFLDSDNLKEHWTSAIALGRHKHEAVFSLLQEFLIEGIKDYEQTTNIDELACFNDYPWRMARRQIIALVLGSWGNPLAIEGLRRAFVICREIDGQQSYSTSGTREEWWHALLDHLAYALGQLGAWSVIRQLGLPQVHLEVACVYTVLGALRVDPIKSFNPSFAPLLFHKLQAWEVYSYPLPVSLISDRLYIDPKIVYRELQERFGLTESEQKEYIHNFGENLLSRRDEEDGVVFPEVPFDDDEYP